MKIIRLQNRTGLVNSMKKPPVGGFLLIIFNYLNPLARQQADAADAEVAAVSKSHAEAEKICQNCGSVEVVVHTLYEFFFDSVDDFVCRAVSSVKSFAECIHIEK